MDEEGVLEPVTERGLTESPSVDLDSQLSVLQEEENTPLRVQTARRDLHFRLDWTFQRAAPMMALTSVTTAIAFYGTALSRVLPLRQFGIFMG